MLNLTFLIHFDSVRFITGPPIGPVLFCSLASVVCRRRLSYFIAARPHMYNKC